MLETNYSIVINAVFSKNEQKKDYYSWLNFQEDTMLLANALKKWMYIKC